MKRLASLLILSSLIFTSCTSSGSAANLSAGITPQNDVTTAEIGDYGNELTDFGVNLFSESFTEETNTLISPLSILYALAMTANGAEGDTLAQMEEMFGIDTETLNACIKAYSNSLPKSEKYKLNLANSIWFTDAERFNVNENFLQTNADYFGADIFKAPFDSGTKNDINNWVKEKTDGMIPKILDKIPPNAVMFLVNALAFEAEWLDIYEKDQVHDTIFTTESGDERTVEMMYSDEGVYLEDEYATGFIKYYSDRKYAFAALLPNEGTTVSDYISTLTGETLRNTLINSTHTTVNAGLPKFEFEFDTELSAVLSSMGMSDAFDEFNADFSGLGTSTRGNIFVSSVLHKTYISVGEKGTKAGAATVVVMEDCMSAEPLNRKNVILDRPFVFMLIDTETMLPFFIGSVMDIE